jgi:hypothetical protein
VEIGACGDASVLDRDRSGGGPAGVLPLTPPGGAGLLWVTRALQAA